MKQFKSSNLIHPSCFPTGRQCFIAPIEALNWINSVWFEEWLFQSNGSSSFLLLKWSLEAGLSCQWENSEPVVESMELAYCSPWTDWDLELSLYAPHICCSSPAFSICSVSRCDIISSALHWECWFVLK